MMSGIVVKVKGLNLSRLLNKLIANNVLIQDVIIKKHYMTLTIEESKLKEFKKICRLERKGFKILKRYGKWEIFKRLPYLFGSILAIIISFCYMFSFDGIVHNINLTYESETEYNLNDVKNVLQENDIVVGMKKRSVSTQFVQKTILKNCENIAGCSVKLVGGDLDITVYPAVHKLEITGSDLLSKYDAVITKAEASAGDLLVELGTVVRVGDILIKNNNGASGKVYGKVYFVGTSLYNERQQYYEKTGRVSTQSFISICNKRVTKLKNDISFTSYFEEKCDFLITNTFLPIKKETIIYYETVIKEKLVLFDNVEEDIKNLAYEEAIKKLPQDVECESITYSVVREGEFVKVDCYLECEMSLI